MALKSEDVDMKAFIQKFFTDEDGAVTVDWVVLTAATVGLGLIIVVAIKPSTIVKAEQIADVIATTEPS
jgi:Flp pilus assembly pilin Flp